LDASKICLLEAASVIEPADCKEDKAFFFVGSGISAEYAFDSIYHRRRESAASPGMGFLYPAFPPQLKSPCVRSVKMVVPTCEAAVTVVLAGACACIGQAIDSTRKQKPLQ
jgi:hypothetical protein